VLQEAPIEDAKLTEELVKWLMNDEDDAQIEDAIPIEEWETWLNDIDDAKEKSIMFMHDNRSDYRPPNSLTGVFSDDVSSDDNDSDLLTPKTVSKFLLLYLYNPLFSYFTLQSSSFCFIHLTELYSNFEHL
jgi:hypothetical protein